MNGYVYGEGFPLAYWVAVRGTALSESFYKCPREWQRSVLRTLAYFEVPFARFLVEVGREREKWRRGLDWWPNEIIP